MKEKTADEMLKELGYKKIEETWFRKEISKRTIKEIMIFKEERRIYVETFYYNNKGDLMKKEGMITAEELQAINKKVEELGWI